ncbi:WXG100 family type VII secretion target [Nocardia sp. 2YAB30]|uniref:WXG100 family type VII secretion target n=1 Tax=Nocardia sp. 2YAB30 TaxID=3233022 RepID=UPI003F9651E7
MSGYENTRIPNGGEQPDSWEHPRINNAFNPLDTLDAVNQAGKYWSARNQWEQGVETFARSIQNSIAQAWSGPAAEQSKKAIAEYTSDAQNLTASLEELYCRVRDAATAIANTKKALPDPVLVTWTSWAWPPHRWDLQRDQSEAEQTARAAMRDFYVKPFSEMDGKIPVLPTPVGPTASVDIPPPPPGGYKGDDGGGPTSSSPGNSPGTTDSGVTNDKDGDDKTDKSGTEEQSGSQSTQEQQSTTPTSTTPTGLDPTATTPANTADPTKTVPTSTGTHSSPGTPGSPGTTNQPQPGRSIAATPQSPNTSANPAAAAAATTSARSSAGVPGMGAPGARGGGKDDESEHKTPDYLINQENTDELLGEIPRTVPGGVIGGSPG